MAASLFEEGKIVFSLRDVERLQCVDKAVKAMRADPVEADSLLRSLYNDFGILVERAPGLYTFSHLTLHEYLTALFIVDNRREAAFFNRHRGERTFFEVLRLLAKMLPNAFDYMSAITTHTQFSNSYQVELLRAAWTSKPLCSESATRQLMIYIAARTVEIATVARVNFETKGDTLFLRVPAQPLDLINLRQILVWLIDILNNSGLTYRETRFAPLNNYRIIVKKAVVEDISIKEAKNAKKSDAEGRADLAQEPEDIKL
jgi:hypothetical protein